MTEIYVVTDVAENNFTVYQWVFFHIEDAEKCRYQLDKNKGATSTPSTIHKMHIYDSFEEMTK